MKKVVLVVLLCILVGGVNLVYGEPVPPKQVVKDLVSAAKRNNLDSVLMAADFTSICLGRHGREPRDFVEFLRGLNLNAGQLSGRDNVIAPYPEKEQVRFSNGTLNVRFDLELRRSEKVRKPSQASPAVVPIEPRYVVVEIHSHP